MILEAALLNVRDGVEDEFEASFREASHIISTVKGYVAHELHQCIEVKGKYLLLVRWNTLEDHTLGFRGSQEYQEWKRRLHHFYEPFPTVEHFVQVELNKQRQT